MPQKRKTKLDPFALKTDLHHWVLYAVAAALYFAISLTHFPGFTAHAQQALAVFAVAAFLWITSALPIAITGILVLLLLPISGAISANEAYGAFGNHAVFFILGAFILASPVMRSGLSTRIAVTIIAYCGRGPYRLLLSILLLSACLAFVISEHAVAAMLFPIMVEIVNAANVKKDSKFGFAAFVAMGWGAVIGGTATLLGGARAALALGLLQSNTAYTISFAQWTMWTFPTVVILLFCAAIVLYIIARKTSVNINAAHAQLELHHTTMGKLTWREIRTLCILGLTIVLWIFFGTNLGLDIVAFIGVILAFMFRITTWDEVQQDVQWNIIIMYGSAIALSFALATTGAASGLVHHAISLGLDSPRVIVVIMILLAFVLTEAMSNAAAVAVLMPIALVLSNQYGIDPRIMALAIATSAGLAFMLPVSTPAIAIILNSPYVQSRRVIAWGLLMKIVGICALLLTAFVFWPIAGLAL